MPPMQAALHGAQRNRIHGDVDQHLADRRVHSDSADGAESWDACSANSRSRCRWRSSCRWSISLTMTPMMCARLSRRDEAKTARYLLPPQRMDRWTVCGDGYEKSLGWVLRHQPLTLAVTLATSRADRVSVHHRAQGIFPAAGRRPDVGHHSWPIRRPPFRRCAITCIELIEDRACRIRRSTA